MARLAVIALMLVALLFGFALGNTVELVQDEAKSTTGPSTRVPHSGPHIWRAGHEGYAVAITGPPHLPPITGQPPRPTYTFPVHTLDAREEARSVSFPGPVIGPQSLPTVPIHSVPTFEARSVSFPGPIVGHKSLPTIPIHSVPTFEARSVSFPGPVVGPQSLPTAPIHSVPTFEARFISSPKSLPNHKTICLPPHCNDPYPTTTNPLPTYEARDEIFPIATVFDQPTPTGAGAEAVCVTTLVVLRSPADYGRTKTVYTSTAIETIMYNCHGCHNLFVHTIPEGHPSGYHFRKTITSSSIITQMTQACSTSADF